MALILGLKGLGGWHNSGVCLLDSESDEILFSSEEERFNNDKHTSQYPYGALTYALNYAGIRRDAIDYVAYPVSPEIIRRDLLEGFYKPIVAVVPQVQVAVMATTELWAALKCIEQEILPDEFPNAKILMLDHHDTHAASAFFCSPFDAGAILTIDGTGEYATTTFAIGQGNRMARIGQVNFPNSLGILYTLVSHFLGFHGPNPEGKVMGLAPYGDPKFLDVFRRAMRTPKRFQFEWDRNYLDISANGIMELSPRFEEALGNHRRQEDEPLLPVHMDIAASLQARLEEICVQLARELHEVSRQKNLCMAGGVALNSVTNKILLDETPFERIFIQPASNDGGTPLGAALFVKHVLLNSPKRTRFDHAYLGAETTDEEIRSLLNRRNIRYEELDEETLCHKVANLIAQENVVGWFQGRAELGPRALGNRSILCDPRRGEMRDILNVRVKKREWFRPYAPVVLAEKSGEYFDLPVESPYMLLVAPVKAEKRSEVAAVTHVDGSARVQTLRREQNPKLYRLLEAFESVTGVPVLLNTSFNFSREAIVNSPEDALDCFLFTHFDYLVLHDVLISKAENLDKRLEMSPDEYLNARRSRFREEHGDYARKHENRILDRTATLRTS